MFQVIHLVQADEQQQNIPHGGTHGGAAPGVIGLLGPVIQRKNVRPLVIRPFFPGGFAQGLLQAGIAALLGEGQVVHTADGVKLHKLVVLPDLRVIAVLGHNAGHVGRDGIRPEILQHADTLVAFLYIETAQILKAADRVTDALFHMGHTQRYPLGGKFGFGAQQRQEVGGKRRRAPRRLGAHHQFQRDLHRTDGQLVFDILILQDVIQHRQIRILARRHFFAVIPLRSFLRVGVFFQRFHSGHGHAPCSFPVFFPVNRPGNPAAYTVIISYSPTAEKGLRCLFGENMVLLSHWQK